MTQRLQHELKQWLQQCLELQDMILQGTETLLIATGRIYGEADYLVNIMCPYLAEFVEQAGKAAAVLICYTGLKMPLWSPVLINSSCIAQIIKVTELLQLMPYSQME